MLVARLPHPISVNGLIRKGRYGNLYKTREAKDWTKDSIQTLRNSYHWSPLGKHPPKGRWFIAVQLGIYTQAHDVDNLSKLTIDTLAECLDVNDYFIHAAPLIKAPVRCEEDQGIEIVLEARVVKNSQASYELAQRMIHARLFHTWLEAQ